MIALRERQMQRKSSVVASDYDVIIVGAGMAGLSAAALLASTGRRVLLLEAIHYPGGCAASYEKAGGIFDVGATTFSGIGKNQPLSQLFDIIGPFRDLLPANPSMAVFMENAWLSRGGSREQWLQTAGEYFASDQRAFWTELWDWTDVAYEMMNSMPYLPPHGAGEYLADAIRLPRGVFRHLPHLFSSIADRMRAHALDDERFTRFIDAQLLITSQAHSDRVPFLAGAPGLTYPDYPVYSVRGGMLRYALFLEERARHFGANFAYGSLVTEIRRSGPFWQIRTRDGREARAAAVITAIPVFNLPALFEHPVRHYVEGQLHHIQRSGVTLWSAFTMYGLTPAHVAEGLPLNLQVILPRPLEHCGSTTLFLSFSHPLDMERAPSGYRTVTISTHIHHRRPEAGLRGKAAAAWKALAAAEIQNVLRRQVAEFADLDFMFLQNGGPRTFEKYTGRVDGLLGGLPLDRSLFPFRFPRPVTPFDGLYFLGDTVFPGQGLPGVTLGALSLYKRLHVHASRNHV